MAYHPHTGFHYSKLLTYLPYDCGNLAIFQVWVGEGVYLGRSVTGRCCSTCSQYPLASELFSSSIRKSSLSYSSQCGIIPLCQVLQKVTSVSVAVFIIQYSSVIRNITSVPSVYLTATLLYCMLTEGSATCF